MPWHLAEIRRADWAVVWKSTALMTRMDDQMLTALMSSAFSLVICAGNQVGQIKRTVRREATLKVGCICNDLFDQQIDSCSCITNSISGCA